MTDTDAKRIEEIAAYYVGGERGIKSINLRALDDVPWLLSVIAEREV